MSAKATVGQYVVDSAIAQITEDAARYVSNQSEILSTALSIATALVAAGEARGAPVVAIVPVITAAVAAFPGKLAAATIVAKAPF